MAEIVRLYREQAPEEIDRIIDDCLDNKLTTLLLTYFGLRVRYSLGIRRPNLVFLPFRSRSVSRLYFKKSPVRHLTKEFEFGAFKLAFMISFFLTKIKQSLPKALQHCFVKQRDERPIE